MKIDDRITNYEINKHLSKMTSDGSDRVDRKPVIEGSGADVKTVASQDTIVQLSSLSKDAQLMKEIISSENDVREEVVSALKEKIDLGNYHIKYNAVAGKILESSLKEIL